MDMLSCTGSEVYVWHRNRPALGMLKVMGHNPEMYEKIAKCRYPLWDDVAVNVTNTGFPFVTGPRGHRNTRATGQSHGSATSEKKNIRNFK
jgi:hypothetical protein